MKLNGIFYALCCAAAVMPGMTMAQQQDSTKVNKYFDAKGRTDIYREEDR